MSRKGECWDNAVAESFFGTLEQELLRRKRWKTTDNARADVCDYIHAFFNTERRHSTLGQVSPAAFPRSPAADFHAQIPAGRA
jgi:putative transposase